MTAAVAGSDASEMCCPDDPADGGPCPRCDECPAGGSHTWVDNSTENSDAYHARPGEGAHCDECGTAMVSKVGRC